MIEAFNIRGRQLIIIRTLVMNIGVTSASIETILVSNLIICAGNPVGVSFHNFLTRARLTRHICRTNAIILWKLMTMCELLIISRTHSVVLTTVELICIILTVIEAVSCKCESMCNIFVWNTSCMGRITWIRLLLLLLVFQIALYERSDSCLVASRYRVRHTLCVFVVRVLLTSECSWWLRLRIVTTSLTVLITRSITTANLVKIEIMAAFTSWALRKLVTILRKVWCSWCIIRLLSIHDAGASLCSKLSFFLVRWMMIIFVLVILRMWCSSCTLS